MAKSEAPVIYVQRRGSALIPEMAMDKDLIERLDIGKRIKITISEGRSPDKLRFYWAFLGRVVKATGCAPSPEALHSLVKLETGHTTPIKLKGYTVLVPASVAFHRMSEAEFSDFLQAAIEFIAGAFGVTPEQAFSEQAA